MKSRLDQLVDKDEIRELRIRYSHLLDGHELQRLEEVFAENATVEVTIGAMHGLAEIRSSLGEAYRLFDRDKRGNFPFFHAVTNHIITLTGSDTATGRCYLIDFETASKPDPNPLLLLGLYADEYRRIDGHWRISSSRLEVVWPAAPGTGAAPGSTERQ